MRDELGDVGGSSDAAERRWAGAASEEADGPPTGRVATAALAAYTAALEAVPDTPATTAARRDGPGHAPPGSPAGAGDALAGLFDDELEVYGDLEVYDELEVYGPDHPVVAGAEAVPAARGRWHRRLGHRAGPASWVLGGAVAGLLAAGAAGAVVVHRPSAYETVRVHGGSSLFPAGDRSPTTAPLGPDPQMILPSADAASAVVPAIAPTTPPSDTTTSSSTSSTTSSTSTTTPGAPTTRPTPARTPTPAASAGTTRPAATPTGTTVPATTTSTTAPTTTTSTSTTTAPPCTDPLGLAC